jgi:hypothetical protein
LCSRLTPALYGIFWSILAIIELPESGTVRTATAGRMRSSCTFV